MANGTLRTNVEREQYAEWLGGYHWDYFFTATFRSPRKEPYHAIKAVCSEISNYRVARAFVVAEPHQSGDLHTHGLLAGNYWHNQVWEPSIALPWEIHAGLFKRFGRAKVEACNSPEAVTAYCAKYILKQQYRACDYYAVHGEKWAWQGGKLS